jgi:DNA-binding CsgD family transcriptional regulator
MKSIHNPLSHKLRRMANEHQFAIQHRQEFECLTAREKEILRMLANGYSNPDIAVYLHLSLHTVKNHRKNLKAKLKAKSLAELIRYALAFDLI